MGVLVRHDQLEKLERFLFGVRRKYYGAADAKNPKQELKGKDLLSNAILARWSAGGAMPRNLCITKEILNYPIREPDFFMKLFGSAVFGEGATRPSLLSPDPMALAEPFRRLIENVSCAAKEYGKEKSVTLVFDQRLGAQEDIAISVKRFIAGMKLSNVHRYPYFAVSTASPGVQVADIFAHLFSKKIQRKLSLKSFFDDMMQHQWVSQLDPTRQGFNGFSEKRKKVGFAYLRRKRI